MGGGDATGRHVAIIGAGFSGTLLAINLLRHDGPRATLIERRRQAGRGVAYSTVHPEHLLNVRAGNMSALPDDPKHFVRWLEARGLGGATSFAPRALYGDYLDELLGAAVARGDGRLTIVAGDAVDVAPEGAGAAGGMVTRLADGRTIAADTVALAIGNLPPLVPGGIDPQALPAGVYHADPWTGNFTDGLAGDDTVIVLGTGLTMIDVAMLLDAQGFGGRLVALSRRGLIPRAHAAIPPAEPISERPTPEALAAVRAVRARAAAIGWRGAVDEMRPFTQSLWRAMPLAERARFLRHVRPWWDVHRHRIAPQVAERLGAMRTAGRLEIVAGGIVDARPIPRGVRLHYRPRGAAGMIAIDAARIVNGTGPQGDLMRSNEPLLAALRDRGLLTPDPLHIGIDVDQDSQTVARDGTATDRLLLLGPMTRGAFWEIVAVPDIRRQAWSVARRLANAQWVEGEGL